MFLILLVVVAATSVSGQGHGHGHEYTNPHAFASWLKEIQNSDEFGKMSLSDQLLFGELVMAAEQGSSQLTALIKRVTFEKVMTLTDGLAESDINHFERYLTAHLPTRKRDLFSSMNDLNLMHDLTHHMPQHELDIFRKMMEAAKTDTLTQFIDQTGYGTVMRVFTYMKGHHTHDFDKLVIEQLHKESMSNHTTTMLPSVMP